MADANPTMEEASAYIETQGLQVILEKMLQQIVLERPAEGVKRAAELLTQTARDMENTARLKALFSQADVDNDGTVSLKELGLFQDKIGEPMSEQDLAAAFESMGGSADKEIGFEAFSKWYDSARAKGGALSSKGDAATRRKQRVSRVSREGADDAFDIDAVKVREVNEPNTLEYRVFMDYAGKQISPWHDVPLYPADGKDAGHVHMVVEIPKWTRAKFEIATGEDSNPIKQDTKKGRLREYNYGDMLFNYGCFPQTWEDPSHTTPDTGAAGDNDPIDAMEIGTQIRRVGSVVRVKVLGCLAMIDDGETDWKVVCIAVDDPLALQLDDIADVERVIPGLIHTMREWLRKYKIIDGKPPNEFGLEEKALDKAYTLKVVEETHVFWKGLIEKGQKTV